jgi:hypothetical protein
LTVVADEESRLAGAADPPGNTVESLRVRCAVAVFPVAPEPNLGPRALVAYAVGFVAAMAYPLLFPLGRVHFSHVWAEDGNFLGGAANDSLPTVLFQPYAGYLHVLPRLIAEVVTLLPVGWWAAAVCLAAAAVRAALALTVFIASAGHSRSPAVRLLLAAAIVVLPVGNLETINNLANLHWYIPIAAFWLLLARPRTRPGNVLVAVALFVLVLSSPLSLLLVPIALLRFVLDRRRDLWPAIGVLAATAIQAVAIANQTRPHSPVDVSQAVETAEARVPLVTFTGPELAIHVRGWALSLTSVHHSWPGLLAATIALAIAARAFVRGGTPRRAATGLCLGYAVATIGLNLFINWQTGWMRIDQPDYVIQGQRYGVTACYFLFPALVFGLDRYPHRQPRLWRKVSAGITRIAVASLMVAGVSLQWKVAGDILMWNGQTLRHWVSSGPTWSEGVNTARQRCNNGAGGVEIPIDPDGWMTRIPCDRLRTG